MQILETVKELPVHLQIHSFKKFTRALYEDSLFDFARDILGFSDINERTHGEMIDALESESKRKLIVMPRGTFKSSICSVAYPIWLLCKDPNIRILLDSELYTNSKNLLREIKLHLANPKVTDIWGEFKSEPWSESEIIIKQRTRTIKEASITVGGIGTQKTGQHMDVIIHDDLNSPSNSSTQEGREKVIQHYQYNTAILEPEGTIIVVGTRYSSLDIIGWVLRNEVGMK